MNLERFVNFASAMLAWLTGSLFSRLLRQRAGSGHDLPPRHDPAATPINDCLDKLGDRNIVNFHALPVSRGNSVRNSRFRQLYWRRFSDYLNFDLTYTGEFFDTPVAPTRVVAQSLVGTAKAFGAEHSFYVTTGTTTSNYITLLALTRPGTRMLIDRTCHQSIHGAADLAEKISGCSITLGRIGRRDQATDSEAADIPYLLETYRAAAANGQPFQVVVLNASSYEGLQLDVPKVIGQFLEVHPEVTFLVDEAWVAFSYFHPRFRIYTAMQAVKQHRERFPNLTVVATQSAHKTLSALRQASYIHLWGDESMRRRIMDSHYMLHTTSPSYPC